MKIRTLVIAATVAAFGLGAGACSTKTVIDMEVLEDDIIDTLGADGFEGAVTCPDERDAENGDTFECTAEGDDGSSGVITVTQTSDDGQLDWEVTSFEE